MSRAVTLILEIQEYVRPAKIAVWFFPGVYDDDPSLPPYDDDERVVKIVPPLPNAIAIEICDRLKAAFQSLGYEVHEFTTSG